MAAQPVLSICVPSRNRQLYFRQTIDALLQSERDDVQFVFVDNSDDPSNMNTFMAARAGDPRITYLPSGAQVLSMMENWERAVAAATGRYVTVIGDDDYADPDLAGFLPNLEAKVGHIDALTWSGFNYNWPVEGEPALPLKLDLNVKVTRFDKRDLIARAFRWEGALHVPLCGNSVYHGAISRALLLKIRDHFGGRFFEFPTIDYENAFKVILTGQAFYHVSRPFSVPGVCPLSNSAATKTIASEDAAVIRFNQDLGRDINDDPLLDDTPFRAGHGVTATIFVIQHWLCRKYGFPHAGYEENLIRAMVRNCENYRDRESFDAVTARYRVSLAQWQAGRYLPLFQPHFTPAPTAAPVAHPLIWTGIDTDANLHFAEDAAGTRTPGELFEVLRGLMTPADEIEIALH
ncbi:glycosyltransferase family 2 protein [Rhizobium sp. C4]|uniref:glycosyltransferase family 2 protein n=1 Tax=Rhizobium sp. C4 TaxID=1349800 RepID=UPI001E2BBD36|nr:glycosyltransferase [Rhizobium sp. C4]MCD2173720.1 glycosyltransferase [Rhizobium sp. C4]